MAVESLHYIEDNLLEDIVTEGIGKMNTDSSEHDFTVQTWKEDFCLIVEDKRFYVARIVLALASPVFERMFQADFKEKGQKEMNLPGKRSADVEEFLKCIYPDVMKEVTIENAFQIIALAEEYQVQILRERCEACFLIDVNETASAENIFKMVNLATLYSINTVLEKCTTLAAKKSLEELDRANEKAPIPHQSYCAIYRKMIEQMKSEQHEADKKLDRVVVLYKYHRAGVNSSHRLQYDDFVDWEGKSVHIKHTIGNVSDTTYMCGTLFNLRFDEINHNLMAIISLHDDSEQLSQVKLVGNIVLYNGIEGKKNICKKVETELNRHKNSFEVDLSYVGNLKDEGYIYNGEISVECNFLALKRNRYSFTYR